MKWKDSGTSTTSDDSPKEEAFDEEQFSPWSDQKEDGKANKMNKPPLLLILLSVALIGLVVVLVVLLRGDDATAVKQQYSALEQRIRQLEERLSKYDTIDEKVTRIWEQAQSFEKFKDRFERSEASISLRMDHLTMGLENLQKQAGGVAAALKPQQTTPAGASNEKPKTLGKILYHQVSAGDTLFSIAKRYNLTIDQLLKINRMDPNSVIKSGQKLIVREGAE